MLNFKNIAQYHQYLTAEKNGCVNAVKHYVSKIQSTKRLNAFVEVYENESLERGAYLDNKRADKKPLGKLHGVVVAIKDVICYKDHRITAASAILKNFVSVYNATAVEKLLSEDAIIIGVCNCDEFAMGSTNENSVHGKVINSLDENKVPGGSSGGSAVAVQAGLCMVSLGSDTGGSVRQPADFCGVVGLKPTYGRISRYGLIAYASSFDQIGIFGNNIDDVALVLEVISGEDDYDSTVSSKPVTKYNSGLHSVKKPSIAYFKNALEHPSLDTEVKDNILTLIKSFEDDGYVTKGIDFDLLNFIVPVYYVLTTAEASSNLSRYDGIRYGLSVHDKTDLIAYYTSSRSKGFGKEVKRRIMLGTFVLSEGFYDAYFTKAQQVRRILADQTKKIFDEFDLLIMPTVTSTAFTIGEMTKDPIAMYLADIYTVYANLVGIPSISIPLFKHSNGLPFGLQVMADKFNELSLLQFSDLIMSEYRRG